MQLKVFKSCVISSLDSRVSQEWMSENLNVNEYCNGDKIIESKSVMDWVELNSKGIGAWTYYEYDSSHEKKHRKLYNWFAVNDPRGLAPEGWRIPSDEDWKLLESNLGMDKKIIEDTGYRGKEGDLLKNKNSWNINHKDEFGFNAHPSGGIHHNGNFDFFDIGVGWWSSSEYNNLEAWRRNISVIDAKINRRVANKGCGFYVRCLKGALI